MLLKAMTIGLVQITVQASEDDVTNVDANFDKYNTDVDDQLSLIEFG